MAMCAISPVMWNSGATPSIDVVAGQPAPLAVGLGVEHDVAVGVHRALGRAGGARGVGEERDVVGPERDRRRLPARGSARCSSSRSVVPSGAARSDAGERPRVVARLEVQLGRGDHGARPSVSADHRRRDVAVQALQADQHRRARVAAAGSVELPLAVHRVDRHHDAAGLPRADQRRSRTGARSAGRSPPGRRAAKPPSSSAAANASVSSSSSREGDAPVEVADGVPVGVARHAAANMASASANSGVDVAPAARRRRGAATAVRRRSPISGSRSG